MDHSHIILLMEVQQECGPFQIIHNARSQRGSRSRKSSTSTHDRERYSAKAKKVRKMTMNPESLTNDVIRQIEQFNEKPQVRSMKEEVKEEPEEEFQFWRCLELGSTKIQSCQEMQLQKGIWHGVVPERELDKEFKCNRGQERGNWSLFD